MVDELHKENRRLRDGELREAIAPLIRGLARVTDDSDRIRATRPDDEDLAHIDTRVREVLHDAGAVTVRPSFGDPFDPRLHQAAGSAPTHEPDARPDRRRGPPRGPGIERREAAASRRRHRLPASARARDPSTRPHGDESR